MPVGSRIDGEEWQVEAEGLVVRLLKEKLHHVKNLYESTRELVCVTHDPACLWRAEEHLG